MKTPLGPAPAGRGGTDRPPWFGEYEICEIPFTLEPYPDWPVFRLLDHAAQNFPRSGLVQLGREMKYPEVRDQAFRLAAGLFSLGIRKGDRVATILPTSIQFVLADYAISRAGGVHIPSSFLEPPHVLEHKFKEGSPKALIYLAQDLKKELALVESLCAQAGIELIIMTTLADYCPHPPPAQKTGRAFSLVELIQSHAPNPPDLEFRIEKDLETLLFTGGTTGLPKGCMLTHKNILANAMQSAATFGPLAHVLSGNFSALLAIPFYHSYGHIVMHTLTYIGATQLLVPDPRDIGQILATIKEQYPLLQFGVPTQYMKMLQEELKDIKILGISGSAALPPKVQEQFEQSGSGGIMEGYGLSECSPNTHLNPSLSIRILGGRDQPEWVRGATRFLINSVGAPLLARVDRKTVGKGFSLILPLMMKRANQPEMQKENKKGSIGIPFSDTQIKVMDEAGKALGYQELIQGRVGEMCINGPQRMLGYWPKENEGLDEEGYIHTGDIVKMDERGYFYIVDRSKDMIIVSGYKVYSRELDDLLYHHPAVEAAATIGVPDPERPGSERVKVYIQLKKEHRGKVTEQEIIEYLRDRVAKYALPKFIEFLEEMPLTGVQKVDKKALRAKEQGKAPAPPG